eukprot:61641_1
MPLAEYIIVFTLTICITLASTNNAFKTVTLSNTKLPIDTNGTSLFTGEATILYHENYYYAYFNDWGNCSDVNCCIESNACASCCFHGKSGDCVYANGHNIYAYRTQDFSKWENIGIALPASNYIPGTVFRPQVIYNKQMQQFIMWYEDRWDSGTNPGYAISISSTPQGPFQRYKDTVKMATSYKIGDYDIFIDDDGSAYHVRTGVVVEKLNSNWTGPSGESAVVIKDSSVEGPSMFKRNGTYYILVGKGCCACKGGSNVEVYTSDKPMGPYLFKFDVGSNYTNGHVFNATSPYNYVTRAQGSKVISVPGANGDQYLWLGNQWVTATEPGNPRNKDLLYWTVLDFDEYGMIKQIVREDTTQLSIKN